MVESLASRYEREIARIVEQLRTPFGAERILLFGSAARGDLREDSDVDLIVIKRTADRWIDRCVAARLAIRTDLPVDVLVYTPEEFAAKQRSGNPTFMQILREARTLYDAAAA